jgi:hypothetical protein
LANRTLRFFQNVKFGHQHMGWLLDGFPSLFHASNTIGSSNLNVYLLPWSCSKTAKIGYSGLPNRIVQFFQPCQIWSSTSCSETFTAAYADCIYHGIQSSTKPSDMNSTDQQLRMTWWRSSPSAWTVSFFKSKLQSMSILFSLSISPSHSQSGESTLWASCPRHREDSDSYLSLSTHSWSGWKLCQ